MKYLKIFDTHSEYEEYINSSDKVLPNVSYCVDNDEVHINPYVEKRVVCVFNVTDTSTPTPIMGASAKTNNYFSEIEIDDVTYTSFTSAYTFDTDGEHTVKYTLIDETTVGVEAFYNCISLTSVSIPSQVASFGKYAFRGCNSLSAVHISDLASWCKISFISNNFSNPIEMGHRLYLDGVEVTELVIPDGVTSIGNLTFKSCTSITSVTMPNSVTSIGNNAFGYCNNLTSVELSNNITELPGAFSSCQGLTSITIPDSVTSLTGTFISCGNLSSVTLPSNLQTIGPNSFRGCSSLSSITIPNSVTSIGNYSFLECFSLASLIIPNNVTTIGTSAFTSCDKLTSVTIGSSVTSIGQAAFYSCDVLSSITSLATTAPSIYSTTFQFVKNGGKLYVPVGSTGYNTWMGTGNYYLGKYSWTKVEQ